MHHLQESHHPILGFIVSILLLVSVSVIFCKSSSHVIAVAIANVARFSVDDTCRQSGRKLCARNLGSKVLNSCSLFSLAWFHHIYGCLERVRGIHHCQKRSIRHHLASQRPSCYTCLCSSRLSYIECHWLRSIQARKMRCHISMGDCLLLVGSL